MFLIKFSLLSHRANCVPNLTDGDLKFLRNSDFTVQWQAYLAYWPSAERDPDSSVGIATGYGLDGPRIESRWGGARFSAPVQTGPGAHPPSCTMGTGSFPAVKSGRGVTLTPHHLLVPWSRKSYTSTPPMDRTACTEPQCLYSRAIPLLPLWAVRPVQSLSACTRAHFTFTFYAVFQSAHA